MTRRRTYPRWLVRGLALFALAMSVLAAVFSREHHSTESQRNIAISRLVAYEARTLESSNPALAMQLALVSWARAHTYQAQSALVDTTAGAMPTRLLGRPGQTLIALGDDGHRLAVARQPGELVEIYSLHYAQLKLLATIPAAARSARVDSIAISRSGDLLATGASDGRVSLWRLNSGRAGLIATLRAGRGAVRALAFSPGGGALAAADADATVQRWSLTDRRHPAVATPLVVPGRTALEAVNYSHNGDTLAAAGRHGTLVVWHAHAGTRPLATIITGGRALTALSYSPDGQTLAAGGSDGVTRLWRLASDGRPLELSGTLSGAGSVRALAFSRDGRYLAAGSGAAKVRIWTVPSRAGGVVPLHLLSVMPAPGAITGLAFADDDRRLISADVSGTTLLWPFSPGSSYRFASAITRLSFSPTSPRLTVGLQDGRSDQWDVVDEWHPAPVGTWYATPSSSATPSAYWLKPPGTVTTTTPTDTVTTVTQTVTTGTSTTTATRVLTVFNPRAGDRALRETQAATHVVEWTLNPDSQLFAAACSDHRVWLWDVSVPGRPKLIAKLSGFSRWATAVLFSPNSQTLFAASSDHTIRMWDLSTPDKPQQLANSPLTGPQSPITALAQTPDGRTLAASTTAGSVWLWGAGNPTRARLAAMLTAAHGSLTALTFSPSDSTLVTGGRDGRLTFWHYRPFQVVNRICAYSGTPITPGEWRRYVPGAAYDPPCAKWTPPVVTTTVTTPAP
jgi:WD40 repeat protein